MFVRGDRSVFTSGGAATPTILRTKGTLFTPATPPPTTTVFAGKFESVGNPYASAIDMRNITLPGTQQFFIVWDPRLGGQNGYGAFQTFTRIGSDYYAVHREAEAMVPDRLIIISRAARHFLYRLSEAMVR